MAIRNEPSSLLEMMRGLSFKNKKAAAFGCYGWGGEYVKMITGTLHKASFEIMDESINVSWNPDENSIDKCVEFGKKI